MALTGIKGTANDAISQIKEGLSLPAKAKVGLPYNQPKVNSNEFYTGALSRGNENVLGQCTRKEYINEFIDFWRDDYRAKAKCLCFLAVAFLTFNIVAPFALFCVALAAKYWDHAMWCRNIARFDGNFRTISYGQ